MTTATNAQLDLSPAPAAASRPSMIWAQSQFELRLMLRNGEQILLTLIIPLFLLVGLTSVGWVELGSGARIDIVTPGIFALAIMSTAFTAQAISVGFDRRYGVLKLLGSTPLSRTGLVASKTLAVLAVEVIQIALISSVAFVLGWDPQGNPAAAVLLMIFGTAAFSALGLALAGLLRAEATLAVANGIYLILLLAGGTIIPQEKLPGWLASATELLPSGALGNGLRDVLLNGSTMPVGPLLVLAAWFLFGLIVAARTFRWE
ncbi:MAG: ABC transporter permease [Candidatus Nanopelagicales bacterium]